MLASLQAEVKDVLIVFVMPKTSIDVSLGDTSQSKSNSFLSLGVIPTIRASSVLVLVCGIWISFELKLTSSHFILKISPRRIAVSSAQMSSALRCARLPVQTVNSLDSSSKERTRLRSTSAEIAIIPFVFVNGF